MKSNPSNLSKLTWSSNLTELYSSKPTKSAESLILAGYTSLEDLLWLFPIRIYPLPTLSSFSQAQEGAPFKGRGTILNSINRPNFRTKGKNGAQLFNITLIVKDIYSDRLIHLKWFNSYQSTLKKVDTLKKIQFTGMISSFSQTIQIINPEIEKCDDENTDSKKDLIPLLKIQYPTTNSVSSTNILKVINKIPLDFWRSIPDPLPGSILKKYQFMSRSLSFRFLHGIDLDGSSWSKDQYESAKKRLIYEEFFLDQVKIYLRRRFHKKPNISPIAIDKSTYSSFLKQLPYQLTVDQKKAMEQITKDLSSSSPMMRLIQGDVGCGKTTIALLSMAIIQKANAQSAFMCPTEALAIQHYETFKEFFHKLGIKISLLKGGMKTQERKDILEKVANGECHVLLGTHALIQKDVLFKKLKLVIIDEQHKFGVNQRVSLTQKGNHPHCLIMSATPIPRSLSLTQYGDLDITSIRTMPSNRKGQQTRTISSNNYQKYLSFLKTRLSMGEQAYVVVPSITESETLEIENLEENLEKYRRFFPDFIIKGLHGKLKTNEKNEIFKEFSENKINLLICTSVVEVGINVLNATVMAIHGPERFGLSSLHQMRGRVGRGDKPGFCFLICDHNISKDSTERLQVIENTSDGFKIAEEDLKIRGEGNLFGTEQSGSVTERKIGNILLNSDLLYKAKEDVDHLITQNNPDILSIIDLFSKDQSIFATI